MAKVETIKLTTALARLVELAEDELRCPACVDPPEAFHHRLQEAVKTTRQFLCQIREPPGEFFLSAGKGHIPTQRKKLS